MMGVGDNELWLVWAHESRRQSLVLGCTVRHVVDVDYRASAGLLVRLRDWAIQAEFVYRHQWSVGDPVIGDNTDTMPFDPATVRLLTRTKFEGEEPFP